MPVPRVINLNDLTPAAPAGGVNVKWQGDNLDPRNVSAYTLATGGAVVKTASYTAVAADDKVLLSFNSATAVTLTLPGTPPSPTWSIFVENIGAGALTVSPNGKQIDASTSSLTFQTIQGAYITTDGTNYFTERNNASAPYHVVCFFPSLFQPNDIAGILAIPDGLPNGVTFPGNFAGSRGRCENGPLANVVIAVWKNIAQVGTVTITSVGPGGFVFATTGGAPVSLVGGDYLIFRMPATADAQLQNWSFTLAGTR